MIGRRWWRDEMGRCGGERWRREGTCKRGRDGGEGMVERRKVEKDGEEEQSYVHTADNRWVLCGIT